MVAEHDTVASEQTHAPKRFWHNLDWLSSAAFLGAGVLGAATIVNNIRNRFWQSFVLGYGETITPFTHLFREYDGNQHVDHRKIGDSVNAQVDHTAPFVRGEGGKYHELVKKLEDKSITTEQYLVEKPKLTSALRGAVYKQLVSEFNIPSEGIKGWTSGTIKRARQLNVGTNREVAIAFGTVAFIGMGAISLLRHDKHILDSVDNKLDDLQGAQPQR